ncbi:YvaD family protein [Vibrio sp. S9_S30]|uniref:DUF5360 family protein n=1 Tax=Vibrio sp. S9_S30 TaxID=2720226 RepID=UPI0016806099|nr:DUF5360 family protein [Vibrio sp. S9_S30]MBD1556360.1 YvaD family protein [Vibrio sp. S9_S30]
MNVKNTLLTITELGMAAYWILAILDTTNTISIPPEYMYSDHKNKIVVAWNWSFFPMDIMFVVLGLVSRFSGISQVNKNFLSIFSLSLMFCAGIMAISYWTIMREFDVFWWGVNLWLLGLSSWCLLTQFIKAKRCSDEPILREQVS